VQVIQPHFSNQSPIYHGALLGCYKRNFQDASGFYLTSLRGLILLDPRYMVPLFALHKQTDVISLNYYGIIKILLRGTILAENLKEYSEL
jgi:hypothetical protein